ncbi:MAG: 4Fe-4S binding protein, partial [Bacteroidota bacterium]
YMAHINDKKCPAGVCKSLLTYEIQKEKCTGCGLCKINCPQGAITGEKQKPHMINQEKCIKCGICYDNCRFKAIKR